jgi:predicted CXXCH cytochrome family protein
MIGVVWFRPPIRQPVSFSHKPHADFGCVFCHEGVNTRAKAGLPNIGLCLDCHDDAPVKDKGEVAAWQEAVRGGEITWKKLTRLPEHAYFSHQRHVEIAQIECRTCHGDMAARTTPPPRPLKRITMEFCTDCHKRQTVSNDCARCHR